MKHHDECFLNVYDVQRQTKFPREAKNEDLKIGIKTSISSNLNIGLWRRNNSCDQGFLESIKNIIENKETTLLSPKTEKRNSDCQNLKSLKLIDIPKIDINLAILKRNESTSPGSPGDKGAKLPQRKQKTSTGLAKD